MTGEMSETSYYDHKSTKKNIKVIHFLNKKVMTKEKKLSSTCLRLMG
jgi:hypothetical protein